MGKGGVILWTVAISVAVAGCATVLHEPTATVPPGIVTGGIIRCSGLLPPPSEGPTYVAGTVDVFRGDRLAGQPTTAESAVADGGRYTFSLPAGVYVLVAHWAQTNLPPPTVVVTVTNGQTTVQDLHYYGCL